MRAQGIYDRDGNSYRYCRAVKRTEEVQEREASGHKWDKIYQDIGIVYDRKEGSEPKKP